MLRSQATSRASANPETLGFRPSHNDILGDKPEPLGFRPENDPGPIDVDASICSLPLAVCKAIRERGSEGHMLEADILVEDLPLCARPGGAHQMAS